MHLKLEKKISVKIPAKKGAPEALVLGACESEQTQPFWGAVFKWPCSLGALVGVSVKAVLPALLAHQEELFTYLARSGVPGKVSRAKGILLLDTDC